MRSVVQTARTTVLENPLSKIALVAGAGGIIGKALLEELARTPDWQGLALSRSKGDLVADLSNADETRQALTAAGAVTHVFYAAYGPGGGLAEEDTRNAAMLRNLLDGLEAVGAPLQRVILYQGAKVYGVHLGPVTTPFYEDENPRPIGPNFYSRRSASCNGVAPRAVPSGRSCARTWWSVTPPETR